MAPAPVVTLSSKVWYFWSYAAAAFLIPFLNLYFQRLGFSKEQIGLLTALRPWLSAISGSVFAVLADRCSAHKLILLVTYTATALLRFSLSLVHSFGLMLVMVVVMEVCNSPINIIVDAAVMGVAGEREYGRSRLWGAVGWGCLAPVAGAVVARFGIRATFVCNIALAALGVVPTLLLPIGSLRKQRPSEAASGPPETASEKLHPHGNFIDVFADSAAHSPVSACTRPATPPASLSATAEAYADMEAGEAWRRSQGEASTAHERLEETMYNVAAHVSLISAPELLVYDLHAATWRAPHERARDEDEKAYAPAPEQQPALCQAGAERGAGQPRFEFAGKEGSSELEQPLLPPEPAKQASQLSILLQTEVVLFFCNALLFGYGMGTMDTYLFLFLDELGGSELLLGLTISVTCIAEVPIMYMTGWLLEALGVKLVLHGVMAVYILRLLFYSILQHLVTPWAVLPIELLHGVTFGLAWAAGTSCCAQISPPGLETTTQAIFQGLFSGVGLGLGGVVGGVVYSAMGAPAVFASAAAVLAAGWCACMAVQALASCVHGRKHRI